MTINYHDLANISQVSKLTDLQVNDEGQSVKQNPVKASFQTVIDKLQSLSQSGLIQLTERNEKLLEKMQKAAEQSKTRSSAKDKKLSERLQASLQSLREETEQIRGRSE